MASPNDEWLKLGYDRNLPHEVKNDLRLFGLAEPYSEDTLAGYFGRLLFLDDYGLVVRIERKPRREIAECLSAPHPHILQPLVRIERDNHIFEICPGIPLLSAQSLEHYPVSVMDMIDRLKENLKKDKIDFWDVQSENCGILYNPRVEDAPVPIVIDRNAISTFSDDIKPVRRALGLQKKFTPLRRAFNTVVNAPDEPRSLQALAQAYALCRDFKAAGALACGWQTPGYGEIKTGQAQKAGEQYKKRLRAHHQKLLPVVL